MFKTFLAAALLALLSVLPANAQSSPGLIKGQVPTAGQWNSYFIAKQDYLGYPPVNRNGDTMQGPLVTVVPTGSAAGFNLPHGTSPLSPNNGDMWTTSAGLFYDINGVIIGPLPTTPGTVTSVATGTGLTGGPCTSTCTISFLNAPDTAATATTVALRGANGGLVANAFTPSFTTAATGGGTTTLTVASTQLQEFTGTLPQIIVLPVTSTLGLGHPNTVVNRTTAVLTVQSSGGNLVQTMAPGTFATFSVALITGTTAASWDVINYGLGTGNAGGVPYFDSSSSLASSAGGTSTQTLHGSAGGAPTFAQVNLGTDVTASLPLGNGGTGQTTAATARGSSGLNVESFTGHGDSIYTILATDKVVGTSAAFTASRAWTLPAASAVNPGQPLVVADFFGGVTNVNTLVITRSGSDTINGATSVPIVAANGAYLLYSDGVSKWTAQSVGAASAGGLTSLTCNGGLTGGVITTTGTCALSSPVSIANGGSNATTASMAAGNFNASTAFGTSNAGLSASVGASALTINLVTAAGGTPSSTDPVLFAFHNATAATGTPTYFLATASVGSLVISSGSTMGFANATAGRLWIVAFNDAGTLRLGAINCLSGTSVKSLSNYMQASSTAEGGAGAADSPQVFYTGTAVTTKPFVIVGYFDWSSGLTTAGTWAIVPTNIQLFGPGVPMPGEVINMVRNDTGAVVTGAGVIIPNDDTIPQNTEGTEYLTQAYSPSAAPNLLRVKYSGFFANSVAVLLFSALFRDATANAIAATWGAERTAGDGLQINGDFTVLAGSTTSTTFHVRFGGQSAGTDTFNGGAGLRKLGGVLNSFVQVEEIMD